MRQVLTTDEALRLLPHKQYNRAQLLLAAGKREQGKTTLLTRYVESCEPRLLALDYFDDFRTVRRRVEVDDALSDLAEGGPCRRRLVPPLGATRDYAEQLFQKLIRQRVGDLLLVLDELTLASNSRESEALQTLILQGRRLGIRLAAGIQRIALTPDVMKSEVTELVIFRTTRPRDLETVADWTDRETAELSRKLQVGQCVVEAL